MTRSRQQPSVDVFARTVPLVVEKHYFGEHKKASLSSVQTDADKTYLSLTKRLVNMPETSAIRQCDVRFREWLNTVATPWRPAIWLTPIGLVERADERARQWEAERGVLADEAEAAYPAQVAAMAAPLKELFNPLDYPPPSRFRAAFWVQWRFVDFGVPNALREIRADVFARERQKLAAEGQKAKAMIEQHLAGSLLRITDHLVDLLRPKANGRKPSLRDGALDDLFTFLDTVALRDVTNFTQLRQVTAQLRQAAAGLTPADLRDDAVRARAAEAIQAAREAVNGLVTEETRRAIRLRDDEEAA